MYRLVMRPAEFLPPVLDSEETRLLSGFFLVRSEKSRTVWNLLPADVGLYVFNAMKRLPSS
jgi:hypothetical protein